MFHNLSVTHDFPLLLFKYNSFNDDSLHPVVRQLEEYHDVWQFIAYVIFDIMYTLTFKITFRKHFLRNTRSSVCIKFLCTLYYLWNTEDENKIMWFFSFLFSLFWSILLFSLLHVPMCGIRFKIYANEMEIYHRYPNSFVI